MIPYFGRPKAVPGVTFISAFALALAHDVDAAALPGIAYFVNYIRNQIWCTATVLFPPQNTICNTLQNTYFSQRYFSFILKQNKFK